MTAADAPLTADERARLTIATELGDPDLDVIPAVESILADRETALRETIEDCDTEALRRNAKHRELLAQAWDEGHVTNCQCHRLPAPTQWLHHNPYRGQA